MSVTGLVVVGAMLCSWVLADADPKEEWKAYWDNMNEEFKSPDTSPLTDGDRKKFKRLKTYAYNPQMRVVAVFSALDSADAFKMTTSTSHTPLYKTVGKLTFTVAGVEEELFVYQNLELSKQRLYKNHLFVPFTDLTNFETTYAGGRYLDLKGPLGTELVLEFNKAYNPYCAYNDAYSCPIPPAENHLELKITAGVLVFHKREKH